MKEFSEMSKEEKKKFFSLDNAQRMIRLEQHVSSCFNKPVHYRDTEYYKSMTAKEKQDFENFLKNKEKKKVFSFIALLLPLFFVSLMRMNITGNAIRENILVGKSSMIFEIALYITFAVLIVMLIVNILNRKSREKSFKKHTEVLNNMLDKRFSIKR